MIRRTLLIAAFAAFAMLGALTILNLSPSFTVEPLASAPSEVGAFGLLSVDAGYAAISDLQRLALSAMLTLLLIGATITFLGIFATWFRALRYTPPAYSHIDPGR